MTRTTTSTLTPHSHSPFIPCGPVTATLNFYNPPPSGAKPYNYVEQPPPGEPQRNFSDTAHPTTINDIRGREDLFSLDTHAFAALQDIPSKVPRHTFLSSDANDEAIKSHYYPEIERLLLAQTGAKQVLIFDHTVRRADPAASRNPVTRVHIDQTARSAAQRVELHLPSASSSSPTPKPEDQRVRIINVWRPLSPPITAYPLAFASAPSVPDTAIAPVEHRYPTRTGETAAVAWTEGQEWWYWSGMEEGERVLLQCWDSENSGVRVPHAAFVDPRSEEGVGRESVEVRALVFG
ncbi:MAG: hypothetical protein L6R37_002404 [Teloschistes peruensis]|nr:MAG: hypothetical protein L6R37_002404 [Teloschistes peruensis]